MIKSDIANKHVRFAFQEAKRTAIVSSSSRFYVFRIWYPYCYIVHEVFCLYAYIGMDVGIFEAKLLMRIFHAGKELPSTACAAT